jgi:hypothetical protein
MSDQYPGGLESLLLQLSHSITDLIEVIGTRYEQPRRADERTRLDELGSRIAGLMAVAQIEPPALPPIAFPFKPYGPTRIPIWEWSLLRASGYDGSALVIAGETHVKPWGSAWRGVRDALRFRLATLKPTEQPQKDATAHRHATQPAPAEQAREPLAKVTSPPCAQSPPAAPLPSARHGPGFRSVHWFGTDYTFTATQGACVKLLWDAWVNRTPEVGQEYILQHPEVGSDSQKLADLFKDHPGWGVVIVKGLTRGAYRLAGEGPTRVISA